MYLSVNVLCAGSVCDAYARAKKVFARSRPARVHCRKPLHVEALGFVSCFFGALGSAVVPWCRDLWVLGLVLHVEGWGQALINTCESHAHTRTHTHTLTHINLPVLGAVGAGAGAARGGVGPGPHQHM